MAEHITVKSNTGLMDGVQALLRYVGVIAGFVTAMLALFRVHDIAGMAAYVQANIGTVIGAVVGLISLATAAYGVFKSGKRGSQLADAGADSRNKTITTVP